MANDDVMDRIIDDDRKKRTTGLLSSVVTNPALGYAGYSLSKNKFAPFLYNKIGDSFKKNNVKATTGVDTLDRAIKGDMDSLKGVGSHALGLAGLLAGNTVAKIINSGISSYSSPGYSSTEEKEAKKLLNKEKRRKIMMKVLGGAAGAVITGAAGYMLGNVALGEKTEKAINNIKSNNDENSGNRHFLIKAPMSLIKRFNGEGVDLYDKKIDSISPYVSRGISAAIGVAGGGLIGSFLGDARSSSHDDGNGELSERKNKIRDYLSSRALSKAVGNASGFVADKYNGSRSNTPVSNILKSIHDSNLVNLDAKKTVEELVDNAGGSKAVKRIAKVPVSLIYNPLISYGKKKVRKLNESEGMKKVDKYVGVFNPLPSHVSYGTLLSKRVSSVLGEILTQKIQDAKKA